MPPPAAPAKASIDGAAPTRAALAAISPRAARRVWRWLIPLLLLLAGYFAYRNSFSGVFLLDDTPSIGNPIIRQLWPLWPIMAETSRPFVRLSLAINYALGGFDVRGYHAVNLAIHLFAGLTLSGIVRRMLMSTPMRARYGGAAPWLAGAIAIMWTVHPLQTQAVTYVIQRAESMMGLFFLLTLYGVIRGAASSHPNRWYLAAIGACFFGMGSKEVMAVAPVVVLLYDRLFLTPSFREIARQRSWLYAGLAATWLPLAYGLATNQGGEQVLLVTDLTPLRYALTQFGVIVHYLRLAFWPHPLVFDYAWQLADKPSAVLPYAAVIIALVALTLYMLYRRHWTGFWGAWFFLILAPTSSVVLIADIAFEQRMYLPLAAVVVLTVMAGYEALGWALRRLAASDSLQPLLGAAFVAAVVIALASVTARRNEDYRSVMAMWSDTVSKRPGNPRAHAVLGEAFDSAGKFDEAVEQFSEALRLKPDYENARIALARTLAAQGRAEESLAHASEAARQKPNSAAAHVALGSSLLASGRPDEEAVAQFSEAVRLNPSFGLAHINLGLTLLRQGKTAEALAQFAEVVRLEPDSFDVQWTVGAGLLGARRLDEALPHLAEAVRLKPDSARAHSDLGAALVHLGKLDDASRQFAEAMRLAPNFADAHYNLGNVLRRQGRPDEAITRYNEALRLDPDHADAHLNLGAMLLARGSVDDALAHLREAVRLRPNAVGAHTNLAAALLRQGNIAEAVAQFSEAVRLDPASADAHYNLAIALAQQGKLSEAAAQYGEAARIDPAMTQASEARASILGSLSKSR